MGETVHQLFPSIMSLAVSAAETQPGNLDAIIVPTARSSRQLANATALAAQLECHMIVLSSKESAAAEASELGRKLGATVVAVDVSDPAGTVLPEQSVNRLLIEHRFSRDSDLSMKRNLGLLISRMIGWQRVLFLDDDISQITARNARLAAGLLEHHEAVGLRNAGWPDNSVVCHAYREVGGKQGTFVSGGMLAIAPQRIDTYFPDVYNEDWFFLCGAKRLAIAGSAVQAYYDPFATPRHARDQELGDCLAEGVYWLRENAMPMSQATTQHFWRHFLTRRTRLINDVLAKINQHTDPIARDRRIASLTAARQANLRITPQLCSDFIRSWQMDKRTWRSHLDTLPSATSVEDCLPLLHKLHGQPATIDWSRRVHHSRPPAADRLTRSNLADSVKPSNHHIPTDTVDDPPIDWTPMPNQQRLLDINGTRIFADIRGDATNPPLLFIHGGPGMSCWDFMNTQGDRLAQDLYLIGIDHRGVLRSDPLPHGAPITHQTLVDDFEAVRHTLNIPQWTILGHSAGGGIALHYAHQHPDTVNAAIYDCATFDIDLTDRSRLPAIATIYDELEKPELAQRCREAATSEQRLTFDTGYHAHIAEIGDRIIDLNWHNHTAAAEFNKNRANSGFTDQDWERGESHLPLAAAMYHTPQLHKLPELRRTNMLIHGRHDLIASPDQIQAFRDHAEGPVITFENSNHFPYMEEPDTYTTTITEFTHTQANR